MRELEKKHELHANRLLASLPSTDFQNLLPRLEIVQIEFKQVLNAQNEKVRTIYFPLSIVGSVINILEDGAAVEVATIGNEGMIGLPVFLGSEQMPSQVFCQVAGAAARMDVDFFREASHQPGPFRQLLEHYTQALFNQIAQNAACNRIHSLGQRCARWLLMTHDRAGSDTFSLTQEFLARMLGVRRAGVNAVAIRLQKDGLITYTRGQLTILNRPGLVAHSCKCYEVITGEYRRLIG